MKQITKAAGIFLSGVIAGLGAVATAHADITGTNTSASMQILYTSSPDVGQTQTGASSASVNITQAGTGINVNSSMTFSSLSASSAVFDFSIGMHGNGYIDPGYFPYFGALGSNLDNTGRLTYSATEAITATVTYDFLLSGSNVFGMNLVYFYNPTTVEFLSGASPVPGHYSGTETFNLNAGNNYSFQLAFDPNVNGGAAGCCGVGTIDGQYQGTMTFDFRPVAAPVPEPESYAMLLAGLGLLGFAARRRKLKLAA